MAGHDTASRNAGFSRVKHRRAAQNRESKVCWFGANAEPTNARQATIKFAVEPGSGCQSRASHTLTTPRRLKLPEFR